MAHIPETLTADAGSRWDPLVRITHWGVAAAVLINGLITEGGGQIHVWIGYAAFSLLALRLVWGLVGPEEARFSAFPPSFSAAWAHLSDMFGRRLRRHRSHNPLGALMVYALWGTLAVVTITGIALAGSPLAPRPAKREAVVEQQVSDAGRSDRSGLGKEGEEDEGDELLEEIHEVAANLLLILAALHVAGVGLESWLSGRNLPREMVTGERLVRRR